MAKPCSKKHFSSLLSGIRLKHNDDYYFTNCIYSFKMEKKLKSYEIVCKSRDYCHVKMLLK